MNISPDEAQASLAAIQQTRAEMRKLAGVSSYFGIIWGASLVLRVPGQPISTGLEHCLDLDGTYSCRIDSFVEATSAGRKAFNKHVAALEEILRGSRREKNTQES